MNDPRAQRFSDALNLGLRLHPLAPAFHEGTTGGMILMEKIKEGDMAKKVHRSTKMKAGNERIKHAFNKALLPPPAANPTNGENSVAFNKYVVVYSNNVSGNLSSAWRAGVTEIGCYMNTDFVGTISFYETTENMNGGYIDANGVIVVEYPIAEFEDVMRILRTFKNLSLLFVENDQQGVPLAHPVGALMTFQYKPIGRQ